MTLLLCGLSMHLLYRIHTQLSETVAKCVYVLRIYPGTRYSVISTPK